MKLSNTDGVSMTYFFYGKRNPVFPIPDKENPITVLDLTFCVEGKLHYWYNGERITLNAGDAILMIPGSNRLRDETPDPGALYCSINILFDYEEKFEIQGYLPGIINSDILFLLELLKKEYPMISEKRNEKCLAIFEYIYNYIYESKFNTENPHVKAIKQYIYDHLSEEITLEKIANHVHLAPQYICSIFKKQTGSTIMQFVLKTRIDSAKTAIIATNEPISEIAEACGFNDYCYFSHAFKRITGISANQYKKNKSH